MSKTVERKTWAKIALTTDDIEEAYQELRRRRSKSRDEKWDLVDVRYANPPIVSVFRYAVVKKD